MKIQHIAVIAHQKAANNHFKEAYQLKDPVSSHYKDPLRIGSHLYHHGKGYLTHNLPEGNNPKRYKDPKHHHKFSHKTHCSDKNNQKDNLALNQFWHNHKKLIKVSILLKVNRWAINQGF